MLALIAGFVPGSELSAGLWTGLAAGAGGWQCWPALQELQVGKGQSDGHRGLRNKMGMGQPMDSYSWHVS